MNKVDYLGHEFVYVKTEHVAKNGFCNVHCKNSKPEKYCIGYKFYRCTKCDFGAIIVYCCWDNIGNKADFEPFRIGPFDWNDDVSWIYEQADIHGRWGQELTCYQVKIKNLLK